MFTWLAGSGKAGEGKQGARGPSERAAAASHRRRAPARTSLWPWPPASVHPGRRRRRPWEPALPVLGPAGSCRAQGPARRPGTPHTAPKERLQERSCSHWTQDGEPCGKARDQCGESCQGR